MQLLIYILTLVVRACPELTPQWVKPASVGCASNAADIPEYTTGFL